MEPIHKCLCLFNVAGSIPETLLVICDSIDGPLVFVKELFLWVFYQINSVRVSACRHWRMMYCTGLCQLRHASVRAFLGCHCAI